MTASLWPVALAGVAAGLAVAMPLGAIAALLLREGTLNGFRVAAAGAAGVATVDLAYCTAATALGGWLAAAIASHRAVFLVASGALVAAIGVRQLVVAGHRAAITEGVTRRTSARSAYARFVGLTAINPLTLVAFAALGGAVSTTMPSPLAPVVFVATVGLASFAWQLGLAAIGAFSGRVLGARAVRIVGAAASAIAVALGILLIVGAVTGGEIRGL